MMRAPNFTFESAARLAGAVGMRLNIVLTDEAFEWKAYVSPRKP